MPIKTKRWVNPREPDDGFRVPSKGARRFDPGCCRRPGSVLDTRPGPGDVEGARHRKGSGRRRPMAIWILAGLLLVAVTVFAVSRFEKQIQPLGPVDSPRSMEDR